MTDFTGETQVQNDIAHALDEASQAGRYMVVVWSIDAIGKMKLHRTTWQWPSADLFNAQALLNTNIAEALKPPVPEPLPVADLGKWKESDAGPDDLVHEGNDIPSDGHSTPSRSSEAIPNV